MPKALHLPVRALTSTVGLPVVGRYGLAHSLLAWARCELWCRDRGVAMLSPDWNHLRVGPYLRRERDKREYHRLFRFPSYITGLRRRWLIWTRPHVPATALGNSFNAGARQVVVFENKVTRNFEEHFHEVIGRGAELLQALRAMTRPRYLPDAALLRESHIAVHVRLGDFSAPPADAQGLQGLTNTRLPIDWYVHALSALRTALGRTVPAIVYSDGDDAALAQLLALPAVSRAPRVSAVTDLLSIAQAAALVSSGSGFSIWGSFLGGAPRLCFPGQRLLRVHGQPAALDLEPELDFGQAVSPEFARAVGARLG